MAALRRRFPADRRPKTEDLCYATTNRQRRSRARPPRTARARDRLPQRPIPSASSRRLGARAPRRADPRTPSRSTPPRPAPCRPSGPLGRQRAEDLRPSAWPDWFRARGPVASRSSALLREGIASCFPANCAFAVILAARVRRSTCDARSSARAPPARRQRHTSAGGGHRVWLLDQKPFPRDKVLADLVGPVALRRAAGLGLELSRDYGGPMGPAARPRRERSSSHHERAARVRRAPALRARGAAPRARRLDR